MARREGITGKPSPALREALAAVLDFTPTRPGEEVAQTRAVTALEAAIGARRNRITLSGINIHQIQWRVIMGLYALMIVIVTVAMVQAGNRISSAIALFLVSSATATSFMLLLAYDHPLNARGGVFVEPAPLRELMPPCLGRSIIL